MANPPGKASGLLEHYLVQPLNGLPLDATPREVVTCNSSSMSEHSFVRPSVFQLRETSLRLRQTLIEQLQASGGSGGQVADSRCSSSQDCNVHLTSSQYEMAKSIAVGALDELDSDSADCIIDGEDLDEKIPHVSSKFLLKGEEQPSARVPVISVIPEIEESTVQASSSRRHEMSLHEEGEDDSGFASLEDIPDESHNFLSLHHDSKKQFGGGEIMGGLLP